MRRKAVKAVVMHTKDSIQHLKDDDDEMLRGEQPELLEQSGLLELIALHAICLSGMHVVKLMCWSLTKPAAYQCYKRAWTCASTACIR